MAIFRWKWKKFILSKTYIYHAQQVSEASYVWTKYPHEPVNSSHILQKKKKKKGNDEQKLYPSSARKAFWDFNLLDKLQSQMCKQNLSLVLPLESIIAVTAHVTVPYFNVG